MPSSHRLVLFLATLVGLASTLPAAAQEPFARGEDAGVTLDAEVGDLALPQRTLVVGTKVAAPFAIKDQDGSWRGLSIDLWRAVADDLNLDYRFEELPLDELLRGVEEGRLDAAVAALTMTPERETRVDFTHPYFTTGLGIAVPARHNRWIATLRGLVSWRFLQVILALSAVLLLAGTLVWLFERRHNEDHFGGSFIQGLGHAFWWSAVTMTTVGYGDKAPVSVGGRAVALIWMFVSVIVISGFTAGIASSLTVNEIRGQIKGPEDLYRVHVTTVEDTTSESYLVAEGVRHSVRPSVEAALEDLRNGDTDAVVYDAPILLYLASSQDQPGFSVLAGTFVRQDYGIAVPEESPLREALDRTVLEHIRRPQWQEIQIDYLGTARGGA